MKQCSEKAFAECKSPMRCKSREVAFFLPGSQCDDFNRAQEKTVTNGDALRAMTDKELAQILGDKCICPPTIECQKVFGDCDACWLQWLQQPAEKQKEND